MYSYEQLIKNQYNQYLSSVWLMNSSHVQLENYTAPFSNRS